MTNTTTAYLSIADNLARYQKLTSEQGSVKTATAYYEANIGKVSTINQFVSNYRLLSYALNAYGLGDQINNTALIKKVLEGGTTSSKALANTLPNPAWKAFAKAYDFSATSSSSSTSSPTSSTSVSTTVDDYVEQQLEANQGESDPGVQLALYFARVAPTVKNSYGILGDQNLLEVVQTIFGLSSTATSAQIDAEAKAVEKLMPVSELSDPKKLQSLVERFTASYDLKYGPASGSSSSLAVESGNAPTTTSAASTLLSQIVSANSLFIGSDSTYTPLISPSLLAGIALGK